MPNSVGTTKILQQTPVCQSQTAAVECPQNYQVPNYSGVNIQIFNPSVTPPGAHPPVYNVNAPSYQSQGQSSQVQMQGQGYGQCMPCCYPPNYYTQQLPAANNGSIIKETESGEKVKTEKRKVVQLTDEYIKNLENYLNSQDKSVRYMGAKEVVARLEEDEARCDDLALNALINKMLKDPYDKVRFLALASLKARIATGNDESVQLLKDMQSSKSAYGMDAPLATEVLLQMSGKKVEKEFVVKETQKETKTKVKKD